MKVNLRVLVLLCALLPSASAGLIHRWSFDADGSDSVGGADAMLQDGAVVSGGQLELNGSGAHATLPIDATLSGLTDATFEAWVTYDQLTSWARVFDFGNGAPSSAPTQGFLFLTGSPRYSTSPQSFAQFSLTQSGNVSSEDVYAGALPGPGMELHLVVVIDAVAGVATVYLNGWKLLDGPVALTPADIVSADGQEHNWLGRSRFSFDSFLDGSYNEFRIHDTALSAAAVLASYHLGPDTPPTPDDAALTQSFRSSDAFSFQLQTFNGLSYEVQYTDSLNPLSWNFLKSLEGNGSVQSVIDDDPPSGRRFYRARVTLAP